MSFFEIFNPGMRHLREERDRQRMLVSKPTHGGGAPLGIDLDGGTAKITVKPKKQPQAAVPPEDAVPPDALPREDAVPTEDAEAATVDPEDPPIPAE